ncbi:MAG: adenylate/guanylate cyclase domain-containing protein [Gammaproteobacteria bacterium]|nr:adenylate/guanylate cyclase domain-containing protein [Gammaproteobacteria bacterium]
MSKYVRHAWAIVAAGCITFFIAVLASGAIRSLELTAYDKVWRLVSGSVHRQSERRIIVVDIDEMSIEHFGSWPWPRSRIAELIEKLDESGVALQVYDVVFPGEKPENASLSNALAKVPSVMAQILALDSDERIFRGRLQNGYSDLKCHNHFAEANAYIANHPTLVGATAGHITPKISFDGIVRKMPAVICFKGLGYPALAVSAIAQGGAVSGEMSYQLGQGFLSPFAQLQYRNLPGLSIPVDEQGDILLPWWLSRDELLSVSAKEVLEGAVPEHFLKNAWVIVGSTAFGIGDAVPTPLAGVVSGVEVHAQLMAALLDQNIPYALRHGDLLQWVVGVFFVFLLWVGACYFNRGFVLGILSLSMGLIAASLLLPWFLLTFQSIWLPTSIPVLFVFVSGVVILVQQYYFDRREIQLLYRNLSSYLPEHVAMQIAKVEPSSKLQARHEQALVVYADLRNFSIWCNRLSADESAAILHGFYSLADRIVRENGGVIEEYVGDSILAVWDEEKVNSLSALKAAQDLVSGCDEFFGDETYQADLPPLGLGVGIDYGDVLVGSFGSERRRAYTLLGVAVSRSIRIQEMTEELAHPVILSDTVHELWASSVVMRSLGGFWLMGAQETVELFYPDSE